jgi:hypothetical protein
MVLKSAFPTPTMMMERGLSEPGGDDVVLKYTADRQRSKDRQRQAMR